MSSTLSMLWSWSLGLIDRSYSIVVYLMRPKFFSLGWGDLQASFTSQLDLLEQLDRHSNKKGYLYNIAQKIKWGVPVQQDPIVTITEGRFPSPVADKLPDVAKECQFFLVEPKKATNTRDRDDSPEVVVIMLPATGEASKKPRLAMARQLAKDHGWSSAIVTAPFYGARKPSEQQLFFIRNVNDFLHQSAAIMQEAAALSSYFMQRSDKTRVCVTGFSWGAAMSTAATSIAILAGCNGQRLACVPYVGSGTPAVLTDGLLQKSVDWEALCKSKEELPMLVRQRLFAILSDFNISKFLSIIEKRRQESNEKDGNLSIGALKVVATRHDHIIRHSWAMELIAELNRLTSVATTKLPDQWLPGGHVVAAICKHRVQKNAIVEAVQALK